MGRGVRGEDLGQSRMERDFEGGAGLLLPDRDSPVADMLAAHANNIATALPGVEQQTEGEPRAGSDRVPRFELRNIVFGPCPESGGLRSLDFDSRSRIIRPQAGRDRNGHHRAQGIEKMFGCMRRRNFIREELLNPLRPESV